MVANGEMPPRGGWAQAIASGAWTSAPVLVGVIASVIAMIPLGWSCSCAWLCCRRGPAGRNKVLVQELAAIDGLAC